MTLTQIRILNFGIVAGISLLYILLERIFPYKEQKLFRKGFWNDLIFYSLIQSVVLGIGISFLIEFIDNTSGISRFKIISHWPVYLQVIFFVVTHDLYIYLMHRWQHRNKYLWRTHEAHHTPEDINWLAGARSHPVEILINQFIEFAPIVLLGAPPEVAVYKATISAIWGLHIHCNIRFNTGWLQYIINGSEMHRWHHAPKTVNTNFATKLAFWDWLFKTGINPKDKKIDTYGTKLPGWPEKNYFKQVAFSFRPFKRKKK